MHRILWGVAVIVMLAAATGYANGGLPIPQEKPTYIPLLEANKKSDVKQGDTPSLPIDLAVLMQKPTDRLLNKYEVGLYKEILKFQAEGNWNTANLYIEKIDNPVLMGHVLAQRYFHPEYQATPEEWLTWQSYFYDLPQSKLVDKKLGKKKSTYASRVNGTLEELRYFSRGSKYLSMSYNSSQRYEVNLVRKKVAKYLEGGRVTQALNYFNAQRVQAYIDPIDKAQILAEIASHYLYLDRRDKAKATALKALKSSDQAPLAGWVMGLIAWMDSDMKRAAEYFITASNAKYASPWMTSAAAYWGARASTRAKEFRNITPLLDKAMQHQRTFYGLIATKAAGYGYDFNWTMPELNARHKDILIQYPAGARVLALIETGQLALAEEELFSLPIRKHQALAEAAIALSHRHNLAGYAMRFSLSNENPAGGYYDGGMFPVSSWTKNPKYADQAVLNAFIRQESRFRAGAKNGTGATGLMQIMPDTAAYIMDDENYKTADGQRLLANPKLNVEIGEKYLRHLLRLDAVQGDLFGLAIAYNAGPGKLSRWKRELAIKDPLLFIELIPSSETRAFIERVVTNYWVYQMQMGKSPKTLLDVAEGDWPVLY